MSQQPIPGYGQQPTNDTDRTMAVLAHLSPLIAGIVSAGWLSFVGPLLIWMFYKDRSPLVRNASAASFNFHLTIWACWLLGWILAITVIGLPISLLLWVIPAILQVIFSVIGAVRAWRGERYRYPFQIKVLSD